MRAVIVADNLQGGLGGLAIAHARRLSVDHDVLLVGPQHDREFAPGDVRTKLTDQPLNFVAAVRAGAVGSLRQIFRSEKPDVVHAHGQRSFMLAKLAGGRPWVTIHGFGSQPGAPWWHTAIRHGVRRAIPVASGKRAVTVSPDAPAGWKFLPHASPRLAELSEVGVGVEPVFAWVGRLDPQKRPDLFVDAMAAVRGQARGVMLGDGPLRGEVERQITRTDAPVDVIGHADDVSERLTDVRAVVVLSHYEGVPFAVEEAMWMGKPVIISRLPGNEWLAGNAALYADTVTETVAAVRELLNLERAHQLGAAAAQQVRERLNVDSPWPTLEAMYAADA